MKSMEIFIYICIYSLAYACFWQLFNSIEYDVSEVAEYVTGRRMEGSIFSISSIIITISTAFVSREIGFILNEGGFSESITTQSVATLTAIKECFILAPGVALLISAVFLFIHPLNKKRFNKLKEIMDCDNKIEGCIDKALK